MASHLPRVLVVLPEVPGDVVCCRYALRLLADSAAVTAVVRKRHLALVEDLVDEHVVVSDYDELVDTWTSREQARRYDRIVDLHGDLRTSRFVARVPGTTLGVCEPEVGIVYNESFRWRLSGLDASHAAVRHARVVPGYEASETFEVGAWIRSRFQLPMPDRSSVVALCPGSSAQGRGKRVQQEAWRATAAYLRSRGRKVVWFLGPDELDLCEELASTTDSIQSGSFADVVRGHADCLLGMTHDTVHLHVRAHLPGLTCAIFVRGEEQIWGGYPAGISLLKIPPGTPLEHTTRSMIRWWEDAIAADDLRSLR